MLQMRPRGGGDPYAPDRDIANVFPSIARQAAYYLDGTNWEPWLKDYLTATGTSIQDLGMAVEPFARFIGLTTDPDIPDVVTCLEMSGWFEAPAPARLAYMVVLAQLMTGFYFSAVRDSRRPHERAAILQDFLQEARKANDRMRQLGSDSSSAA